RLAFMTLLNERTIRRAIADLIALGLIDPERGFNENKRYYLRIPKAAEEHVRICHDLLTNPRNRNESAKPLPPEVGYANVQHPRTNAYTEAYVNVHLHSEDALRDTRSLRGATDVAPKRSTDSAYSEERGGRGGKGLTITSSGNPLIPSKPEDLEQRSQRLRLRFEALGCELRNGFGGVPAGRRVG